MSEKKYEAWQEITLPRGEGRVPYVTLIPADSIQQGPIEENEIGITFCMSVPLPNEQWAEYLEISVEEFLQKKAAIKGTD